MENWRALARTGQQTWGATKGPDISSKADQRVDQMVDQAGDPWVKQVVARLGASATGRQLVAANQREGSLIRVSLAVPEGQGL